MKKETTYHIADFDNAKKDYAVDFLRTIKIPYKIETGYELDILDSIKGFLYKHTAKYSDDIEAKYYMSLLAELGYITLSEYKNGKHNAILTEKGVHFVQRDKSIFDK